LPVGVCGEKLNPIARVPDVGSRAVDREGAAAHGVGAGWADRPDVLIAPVWGDCTLGGHTQGRGEGRDIGRAGGVEGGDLIGVRRAGGEPAVVEGGATGDGGYRCAGAVAI